MTHGSVVVVGAGLSGLAAAVRIISSGKKVILLEASKKGGGRAYSFSHSFSDTPHKEFALDNGQHIMLGSYHETFHFLESTGAKHLLNKQKRMEVNMVDRQGRHFTLRSGNLPYPFDLLQALLGFDHLSLSQKLSAIAFVTKLRFVNPAKLMNITVSDWLKSEGQTGELFTGIWDILCTGAMNTSVEKASAGVFAHILKVIFLEGKDNAKIVVPRVDLSALFVEKAVKFIEERGSEVRFSEPVTAVETSGGRIASVLTRGGRIENPKALIFAIPAHALGKIDGIVGLVPEIAGYDMKYSSITSFHLRIKDTQIPRDFIALIDSPVQWVFNHGDYISTVTSASTDWDSMKEEDILSLIKSELKTYLGIEESRITSHKMIKEKRATFVCGGENLRHRPGTSTGIKNLFLAGDWTDTGLPATIEGAVQSGHKAADAVLRLSLV